MSHGLLTLLGAPASHSSSRGLASKRNAQFHSPFLLTSEVRAQSHHPNNVSDGGPLSRTAGFPVHGEAEKVTAYSYKAHFRQLAEARGEKNPTTVDFVEISCPVASSSSFGC